MEQEKRKIKEMQPVESPVKHRERRKRESQTLGRTVERYEK